MAGATEVEQIKTNQLLEKVSKETSESKGKISELIQAVQQPSEYEIEAIASDKESTALDKKAQKHDKEVLKGDKIFHKDFDEFSKKEIIHNKFIETAENKKEGIAKAALADQKRKDKLLTRAGKGAWDWTKDKVSGIAKSTMGFMETVGKLMLLVAAWFILQWLKGKDLKEQWETFLGEIEKWKKRLEDWTKWVTDMTKDLNDEYFHFTTAWLGWKTMLKLASSTLNSISAGMKTWFGVDAVLTRRLATLNTRIANLLKREAALQRLLDATDDLATKKPLAAKLKEVRTALTAALDDEAAISRAQKFAETLQKEKQLAKKLLDADDALKLATADEAAAQKAIKLGKALAPESKAALKLAEATEEIAKITKEKSVLNEAIKLIRQTQLGLAQEAKAARETLKHSQKMAGLIPKPITIPEPPPPKPKIANPIWEKFKARFGLQETAGEVLTDTKDTAANLAKVKKEGTKTFKKAHELNWTSWIDEQTKGIRTWWSGAKQLGFAGVASQAATDTMAGLKKLSDTLGITKGFKWLMSFLNIFSWVLSAIESVRGLWGGGETPGGERLSAGLASPSMLITTDMATVVENIFDKFWGDKEWGGKIGIDWKPMKERWMTEFASFMNKNLFGELTGKIGDPKLDKEGNFVFNEKGEQQFVEFWEWFELRGGAKFTDKQGREWKPILNRLLDILRTDPSDWRMKMAEYAIYRKAGFDYIHDPSSGLKPFDPKNLRRRGSETERAAGTEVLEELKKLVEALKIVGENQLNQLGRNAGIISPVTINSPTSVLSAGARADHANASEISSLTK